MNGLQIKQIILSAENEETFGPDALIDFTDVIVITQEGEIYFAPFFSFSKVEALRKEYEETGNFLHGSYFWVEHMVLVEICDQQLIANVVADLIEEGNFFNVFKNLGSSGSPQS